MSIIRKIYLTFGALSVGFILLIMIAGLSTVMTYEVFITSISIILGIVITFSALSFLIWIYERFFERG